MFHLMFHLKIITLVVRRFLKLKKVSNKTLSDPTPRAVVKGCGPRPETQHE